MKYIFVLVFILVFILFDIRIGYTNTSPLYTHLTYIFQHASISHLIINSISFIVVFSTLEQFVSRKIFLPVSFAIAVVTSFLTMYNVSTVGVSSVIYAMVGLYIGVTLFYREIKIVDTRRYLLNICMVLIGLTISMLKTNSNFYIHIYTILLGFISGILLSLKENRNT
ncbi:rhomboid family intramembrane serine protease [Dysgonomonas sp. 511]|uniref:rhomboid family intramembrane serine protease n=1 Tax=Dysgonomonas sp. 511 TaxID=2302930 RepID=UPI0013D7DC7F|nr:rhomboid family intramembrane serine protease [Dysgonomonas sp. 511]